MKGEANVIYASRSGKPIRDHTFYYDRQLIVLISQRLRTFDDNDLVFIT